MKLASQAHFRAVFAISVVCEENIDTTGAPEGMQIVTFPPDAVSSEVLSEPAAIVILQLRDGLAFCRPDFKQHVEVAFVSGTTSGETSHYERAKHSLAQAH
jgi:hypothetical protein